MREIDDVPNRRPALGTLAGEAGRSGRARRAAPVQRPGASALTAASCACCRVVGPSVVCRDRRGTVPSSQDRQDDAVSIYRKLNAGTRGQAVSRARELGLLEG